MSGNCTQLTQNIKKAHNFFCKILQLATKGNQNKIQDAEKITIKNMRQNII